MAEILSKIKSYESDKLDSWFALSDEEQLNFYDQILDFYKYNKVEFSNFTNNLLLHEESCLLIVYEAFSTNRTEGFDFLYAELKRLLTLLKQKKIGTEQLEFFALYSDFNYMFKEGYDYFKNSVEFLISSLRPSESAEYNKLILDVLEDVLIYFDSKTDMQKADQKAWVYQLKEISRNTDTEIKDLINELTNSINGNSVGLFKKVIYLFAILIVAFKIIDRFYPIEHYVIDFIDSLK